MPNFTQICGKIYKKLWEIIGEKMGQKYENMYVVTRRNKRNHVTKFCVFPMLSGAIYYIPRWAGGLVHAPGHLQ